MKQVTARHYVGDIYICAFFLLLLLLLLLHLLRPAVQVLYSS